MRDGNSRRTDHAASSRLIAEDGGQGRRLRRRVRYDLFGIGEALESLGDSV